MTRIVQATTRTHIEAARQLFSEYAATLGIDLEFQGFQKELATLPGDYVPPLGALLLAFHGDDTLGCVALRPLEPPRALMTPRVAELKRLYVAPAGRRQGIGLELTQAALKAARGARYERVRLDTLPSMDAAQRLYERLGFRDIDAYRYNPVASTRYLGLEL